jgi:hypothetical protein
MLLSRKAVSVGVSPEQKLDDIYISVLRSSLRLTYSEEEANEVCSAIQTVLGFVPVSFSSLPASALDALLPLHRSDSVRDLLHDLHSILDVPDAVHQSIRLHHASVRDFPSTTRDALTCASGLTGHSSISTWRNIVCS